MTNHAYICMENDNGTYAGIYLHDGGGLGECGYLLNAHYNRRDQVNELINLGHLKKLGEFPAPSYDTQAQNFDPAWHDDSCIAYGRDLKKRGTTAFKNVTLDKIIQDEHYDYCYIFTREGGWCYFECGESAPPLSSVLDGLKDTELTHSPEGLNDCNFWSELR